MSLASARTMPVRVYKTIVGALYVERIRAMDRVTKGAGGEQEQRDIDRIDTATAWLQAMVTDKIEELSSIGPTPALLEASMERIANAVNAHTVMLESGMRQIRDVLERDYPAKNASFVDYTPLQVAAAVQRAFDRTRNELQAMNDHLYPRFGFVHSLGEVALSLGSLIAQEKDNLERLSKTMDCEPKWNHVQQRAKALAERVKELEQHLEAGASGKA